MQETIEVENGVTKEILFEDNGVLKQLYGEHNENLKEIENIFNVKIYSRGGKLSLRGETEEVELAHRFLTEIYRLISRGYSLDPGDIELAAGIVTEDKIPLEDIFLDTVCISTRKRIIAPKSLAQKLYIEAIRKHDIVFGIGPAGT
ncbi:MAG TPA: phosphate starvation-inducible protein PhoH, partial [Thermodesulfobacteriota bacterium]|nr:phosphate starvation-inducible protein PhoH [Thermodesulfobacteriota bacterium]